MMPAKLWWLIHKDLISERRARRVWPAMLLLGIVVALVFSLQMDLPPSEKRQAVGGLLWLAVFFAGAAAMDRSFALERDDGCWDALRLCPVGPTTIFLAKLSANVIALAALEAILIPLFAVLSDVELARHPWTVLLVAILGNVGIAAVGTLVSAMSAGIRHGAGLLVLLVLPLATPVVLAAAESTRLACEGPLGPEFWRWVQFLAGFAAIFVAAGVMLFDYVVEE
jgi:heme exporter protein B